MCQTNNQNVLPSDFIFLLKKKLKSNLKWPNLPSKTHIVKWKSLSYNVYLNFWMNIWNLWDSGIFIKSFLCFQSNITSILWNVRIPNIPITFSNICVQINLTVHFFTSITISHRCPKFLSVWKRLVLIDYNNSFSSFLGIQNYSKDYEIYPS